MNEKKITMIECPRDAMQGWKNVIPTAKKIEYINALLQVGFDTIDFGSFVSAKAIPQMADTKDVLKGLQLEHSRSKLLAIVANVRGAEEAALYDQIRYLGFPFSVSETFQQRNTNSSISGSLERVAAMQDICGRRQKELVIYISMGFGNPYGDLYSEEIVYDWVHKLVGLGIQVISLADTVGIATPAQVFTMTKYIIEQFPGTTVGVHLHSTPENRKQKLEAAVNAGCLRFDGALKGIGGCPLANDELVGNMNTEFMIDYFETGGMPTNLDIGALHKSLALASTMFT